MSAVSTRSRQPAVRRMRWTREAYDRLIEAGAFHPESRAQLIDGEIIEMSPQGSKHATAVYLVDQVLSATFKSAMVRVQLPLALGDASEPEPDIAVVEGAPRDFTDQHPASALLVVEVSDATLRFDRTRKLAVYARAAIPEYWILDVKSATLEVYREPAGSTYRTKATLAAGETVSPHARPDAAIPVADLLP